MRVFKNYFKIVKAHGVALLIYTGVFLVLAMFFVNSNKDKSYSSVDVSIYVKDNAQTILSKNFYDCHGRGHGGGQFVLRNCFSRRGDSERL